MNKVDAVELLRGKIWLKHLAYSTEQAYCGWVARYCDFVAGLGPALTSEQKVEAFLSSMARGGCILDRRGSGVGVMRMEVAMDADC